MGDLTPITREEYYLARMAGEDVTMPEPITREEEYMKGIAAQIEAGSAELPAVTENDWGRVLSVNSSGKWVKSSPQLILDNKVLENDIGTTSATIYTAETPGKFFASVLLIVINNTLSDKYVGIAIPGTSPGTLDVIKLAESGGKNISLKTVMSMGKFASFKITASTESGSVTTGAGARITIYKIS